MSNPEAPAVTGTIQELHAVELGPEHAGRQVKFYADRGEGKVLVHGVLLKVDTEWSASRVRVDLVSPRECFSLGRSDEVVVITETVGEAILRLGQQYVTEQEN